MFDKRKIKVVAFDADDTLWDNQTYYDEAEEKLCGVLSPYADARHVCSVLFDVECRNMENLGFGAKAFTISLIETALSVSENKIPAEDIAMLVSLGKSLLGMTMRPFADVEPTLREIAGRNMYKLVLLTKGELLPQENKVKRSGLGCYFDSLKIVSDKTAEVYENIYGEYGIVPEQFLMVGNSMKSDIIPVLDTGGWGAFIPFHRTWKMEQAPAAEHNRLIRLNNFGDLSTVL